jgi:hypothetical protein
MTDYKKMLCEDMKLFIFEWVILNPEEGKGIKYVRNLNKQELIKVCMYIDGKLSRDEMMEVITAKQEHFRELARRRRDGYSSSESSDSESDDDDSESDDDDEESSSSSLSSESGEGSESSKGDDSDSEADE